MKTIGLLGGMSWESTALYYQRINRQVQRQLGQLHSAQVMINSVDFASIEALQHQGLWEEAGVLLGQEAQKLQKAGADCVVLCTNTMHKVAKQIESTIDIPFIHIADATAKAILAKSVQKVGLLGTAFTMEQDFYKERLQAQGIEVVIPEATDRQIVHDIIYQELCLGVINPESKKQYEGIVNKLINLGAEGIILGCTEIGMLIGESVFTVPSFDTTLIHADAAVTFALWTAINS